jgi:2-polyprenyl-6-methoxyphenol hydroxylase-like FAD-dependent oxidoreductase
VDYVPELIEYARKPHSPGRTLVGDAGSHKDPLMAQGITDAFRDAELLAESIDAGLPGKQPMAQALAAYERRRKEAAMPDE